jgi:squalene-hopene/tetraprenyl-beta-curcumene cyclase
MNVHVFRGLRVAGWFALLVAAPSWADDAKPAAPAPNRADEPMAREFSLSKAAECANAISLAWTRERKCGTCHTNYAYMNARGALGPLAGAAGNEIRSFFEKRATHWDGPAKEDKPRWDAEVVATAIALAIDDAGTTGKLHPVTRQALDRMWTLQRADGSWNWLKCAWPPSESDDYYGVVLAAIAVGTAPEGYAATPRANEGMAKIRAYLEKNPAPSLHHRAMLLWAASKTPDLLAPDAKGATIRDLLAVQRDDGGFSLTALGDWKRKDGTANDSQGAPSDGYGSGFVVYVLRQAGLPTSHAAIQKGVTWLKTNQRESGRWFTRSVSNDKHHFIANAGSSFAIMALAACGEIPAATLSAK